MWSPHHSTPIYTLTSTPDRMTDWGGSNSARVEVSTGADHTHSTVRSTPVGLILHTHETSSGRTAAASTVCKWAHLETTPQDHASMRLERERVEQEARRKVYFID